MQYRGTFLSNILQKHIDQRVNNGNYWRLITSKINPVFPLGPPRD